MGEPLQFINSSVPDDERPPLWRRGDATILASCRGATGQPDYNPALPGQRVGRDSIFDVDESDGWRDQWEVLPRAQREYYEMLARRGGR